MGNRAVRLPGSEREFRSCWGGVAFVFDRDGPGWGSHPLPAPGFARCGWRSGFLIPVPAGNCKLQTLITACRNAARTRRWAMSARWPIFSRRCCARSRSSAGWRRGSSLRPMPPRNGFRRASQASLPQGRNCRMNSAGEMGCGL